MAKHKARFWEHPAGYITHDAMAAYSRFSSAFRIARLTGDWTAARATVMRGRVGSPIREMSDVVMSGKTTLRWW